MGDEAPVNEESVERTTSSALRPHNIVTVGILFLMEDEDVT